MGFSDETFRERVVRRCKELGKSQRAVLRLAGVAHDYLQAAPQHGRRVDTIEKVAAALDWELSDIMGFQANGRIDPEVLLVANMTANRVLDRFRNPKPETVAQFVASIYNTLEVQQRLGRWPIPPEWLDMLVSAMAEQEHVAARLRANPQDK